MITTIFKLHFSKLRSKVIIYKEYKKINEEQFSKSSDSSNIILDEKKKRKRKTNQIYESLTEIFLTFINEHVLLKKNLVRGNQTHFITKEL